MFSLIFCIALVVLYGLINRKRLNVFMVYLIGFFIVILIGSCLCITTRVYPWYINPVNILVFTTLYMFCTNQFKYVKFNPQTIVYSVSEYKLNLFSVVYLIGFFVFLVVFVPKCIDSIMSGSFLIQYEELRKGQMDVFESTAEKWIYYFVSRLQYPAMIVGFIYLCKSQYFKGLTMIIASFTGIAVYAIYIVSRTDIFQVVLLLTILFIIFRQCIPRKTKKVLVITMLICLGIILFFGIAISLSRAEFKPDNLWILNYLGRSILTFNSIMEHPATIKGVYFLGTQTYFSIAHASYTGSEFIPLFGRFYLDFGWLGFVPFLFFRFYLPTKRIGIGQLYLILWLYNNLLLGILYCHVTLSEIVFLILIYFSLNIFFKKKIYGQLQG